jgi:hypothetical protein
MATVMTMALATVATMAMAEGNCCSEGDGIVNDGISSGGKGKGGNNGCGEVSSVCNDGT